jgi:hypothetical protein
MVQSSYVEQARHGVEAVRARSAPARILLSEYQNAKNYSCAGSSKCFLGAANHHRIFGFT